MKFTQTGPCRFERGGKPHSLKQVIELYKEGRNLSIIDEYGNNVTKEVLAQYAFNGMVPLSYVAEIIDEGELDDMVHCGGYDNWALRRVGL